jgi:hypothetical protein
MRGVFTYRYTRYSECLTTSASGKAYVHVPHGRIPPRPDTVLVCAAHAEAVNINSIAGVELGGIWNRDAGSDPDDIVRDNMHTASTPSQHTGAVIFDVKTAHQQAMTAANPAYDAAYHGVTGKKFVFEYSYTPSGCTPGGVIRVVIVSF